MKRAITILLTFFIINNCFAGHIAGGEIYYQYLGIGNSANTSRYQITLRLFRECGATGANVAQLPTSVLFAIYNNTNPSTRLGNQIPVTISGAIQVLTLTRPNPCISNPPTICYQVANYQFTQELPNTVEGYTVMYQTCCRTVGIENMVTFPLSPTTNGDGATYTCNIPGTSTLPVGTNSSPVFSLKDTTLVCKQAPFKLDFSATDPDAGDSLSYSFCAAYDRGNTVGSNDANYSFPPFNTITYTNGYSGSQPLGPNVTINPVTGIISGISPNVGRYVVNVCINEWRNKVLISQHRKDFTLIVSDCALSAASLNPTYITCNGTTLSFQNESTSSNIDSYLWDFGVPNLTTDTSTSPTPTYDFKLSGSDSGTYTIKLKVATISGCQDSATANVLVYPGFKTNFNIQGTCFLNAYTFLDATTSKYGVVDSWRWNFGDPTTLADTARSKDSAWKYASPQTVQVKLISTNSKGCVDSVTQSLTILDKPVLSLPFRDTLICSIDTLAVRVNTTSGSVLWKPANGPNLNRILNANSSTALVFPRDSTRYYVTVNNNGCTNTDSVMVNVLPFISVDAGLDTVICRTDSFRLKPISDALSYQWTANTGETVSPVKNPLVKPLSNTQYNVIANLGKCQAKDSVFVRVAPYPSAAVGPDVTICFGSRIQLNGTITGASFTWSNASTLLNENTLQPIAGPSRTTAYILTAFDTQGCSTPKSDTIVVTVNQPITAYAGRDTFAVVNQPLQLTASGGTNYLWTPATGLNDPTIYNPIATLDNSVDNITYTVRVSDNAGCFANAQVTVQVYKKGADIFVPSAFTPNGDGKNDALKPLTVGITKLTYFSIYNRWGQLLFTTNQIGKAWDGTFRGVAQPSGTYVYQTEGKDFLGLTVYRKGTVVLIR